MRKPRFMRRSSVLDIVRAFFSFEFNSYEGPLKAALFNEGKEVEYSGYSRVLLKRDSDTFKAVIDKGVTTLTTNKWIDFPEVLGTGYCPCCNRCMVSTVDEFVIFLGPEIIVRGKLTPQIQLISGVIPRVSNITIEIEHYGY